MVPSIEEYNKAKEIVLAYETEQKRIHNIQLDIFKSELTEYFEANLIGGKKIVEFDLVADYGDHYEIIPIDSSEEEWYSGENDDDIEEIALKYDISVSFVDWMYHK